MRTSLAWPSIVQGAGFSFVVLFAGHATAQQEQTPSESGWENGQAPPAQTPAPTPNSEGAPAPAQASPGPPPPESQTAPGGAGQAQTSLPPTYPPLPPGYPPPGYPPPGYPPYYGQQDDRPRYLPYRENQPPPPGYYYEERMRRGPVIAGAIVLGVPYALGLSIAAGANFENQTGWLAVPVLGPWLTLALRDRCDPGEFFDCAGDAGVRTLLVLDALMQTTGGVLLLWGLTSKTQRYVRNDVSLNLAPMSVGTGYGFGALGTF